ncbi:histidine phosphatase superfamily [Xylariales sp. PMI_506]|nr:histidine phosphatase superfamily [Xylariales sp. PMI_506]
MAGSKIAAAALIWLLYTSTTAAQSCDTVESGYICDSELTHSWGQYSPYFAVPSEINARIPCGCDVNFVQILSRHGARYPTASKTTKYNATLVAIQEAVTSYGPGYEFIEDFVYDLGSDVLTGFGQQQMYNSGVKFYQRYKKLAQANTPFFRSDAVARVVQSTQNFTQGFHQARIDDLGSVSDGYPWDILVLSDDTGYNNTLSHDLCTEFESGDDSEVGDDAQADFLSVFGPNVTARVNANLVGANLTTTQTIYLMDLCTFETMASSNGTISQWCSLFTEDEWEYYDYYETLGKYYGFGYGNPLGPTQGVGFVNELIARLTNTSVVDHTTTNSTLDSSSATFPLGLPLYADFSHDDDLTAIFSAMGLYNSTSLLSTSTIQNVTETDGYSAAWTVPFGGRMYLEKMTCGSSSQELVRVIVNDRVLPLETCGGDALGRCTLDAFVDSLSFAREGGFWDQCFV